MGREGSLRVSIAFGNMEVIGDFGRRWACRGARSRLQQDGGHMGGSEEKLDLHLEGRVGRRARKDLPGRENAVSQGTQAGESPGLNGEGQEEGRRDVWSSAAGCLKW